MSNTFSKAIKDTPPPQLAMFGLYKFAPVHKSRSGLTTLPHGCEASGPANQL